jgi:hypothetical protein
MKTNKPISIPNVLLGLTVIGTLSLSSAGWCDIIADNFNDGNDTAPTIAWGHYDPIGDYMKLLGYDIPYVHWSFPGDNTYRIKADPSPDPDSLGAVRGGSFAPTTLASFYVAADVVGWDNTIHQLIALLARGGTVGLGSTSGYLLDWDSGSNPNSGGDMDIARVDNEVGNDLDGSAIYGDDTIHLTNGSSYRFVFMGVSNVFRGQVYSLANLAFPLVDYTVTDPNYDPNGTTHVSGSPGLVVVDRSSSGTGPADVTYDNFLATDGDLLAQNWPLLKVSMPTAGTVCLSWPFGTTAHPLDLYTSSSVSPTVTWTGPLTPTGTNGAWRVYCVSPPTGTAAFFAVGPKYP